VDIDEKKEIINANTLKAFLFFESEAEAKEVASKFNKYASSDGLLANYKYVPVKASFEERLKIIKQNELMDDAFIEDEHFANFMRIYNAYDIENDQFSEDIGEIGKVDGEIAKKLRLKVNELENFQIKLQNERKAYENKLKKLNELKSNSGTKSKEYIQLSRDVNGHKKSLSEAQRYTNISSKELNKLQDEINKSIGGGYILAMKDTSSNYVNTDMSTKAMIILKNQNKDTYSVGTGFLSGISYVENTNMVYEHVFSGVSELNATVNLDTSSVLRETLNGNFRIGKNGVIKDSRGMDVFSTFDMYSLHQNSASMAYSMIKNNQRAVEYASNTLNSSIYKNQSVIPSHLMKGIGNATQNTSRYGTKQNAYRGLNAGVFHYSYDDFYLRAVSPNAHWEYIDKKDPRNVTKAVNDILRKVEGLNTVEKLNKKAFQENIVKKLYNEYQGINKGDVYHETIQAVTSLITDNEEDVEEYLKKNGVFKVEFNQQNEAVGVVADLGQGIKMQLDGYRKNLNSSQKLIQNEGIKRDELKNLIVTSEGKNYLKELNDNLVKFYSTEGSNNVEETTKKSEEISKFFEKIISEKLNIKNFAEGKEKESLKFKIESMEILTRPEAIRSMILNKELFSSDNAIQRQSQNIQGTTSSIFGAIYDEFGYLNKRGQREAQSDAKIAHATVNYDGSEVSLAGISKSWTSNIREFSYKKNQYQIDHTNAILELGNQKIYGGKAIGTFFDVQSYQLYSYNDFSFQDSNMVTASMAMENMGMHGANNGIEVKYSSLTKNILNGSDFNEKELIEGMKNLSNENVYDEGTLENTIFKNLIGEENYIKHISARENFIKEYESLGKNFEGIENLQTEKGRTEYAAAVNTTIQQFNELLDKYTMRAGVNGKVSVIDKTMVESGQNTRLTGLTHGMIDGIDFQDGKLVLNARRFMIQGDSVKYMNNGIKATTGHIKLGLGVLDGNTYIPVDGLINEKAVSGKRGFTGTMLGRTLQTMAFNSIMYGGEGSPEKNFESWKEKMKMLSKRKYGGEQEYDIFEALNIDLNFQNGKLQFRDKAFDNLIANTDNFFNRGLNDSVFLEINSNVNNHIEKVMGRGLTDFNSADVGREIFDVLINTYEEGYLKNAIENEADRKLASIFVQGTLQSSEFSNGKVTHSVINEIGKGKALRLLTNVHLMDETKARKAGDGLKMGRLSNIVLVENGSPEMADLVNEHVANNAKGEIAKYATIAGVDGVSFDYRTAEYNAYFSRVVDINDYTLKYNYLRTNSSLTGYLQNSPLIGADDYDIVEGRLKNRIAGRITGFNSKIIDTVKTLTNEDNADEIRKQTLQSSFFSAFGLDYIPWNSKNEELLKKRAVVRNIREKIFSGDMLKDINLDYDFSGVENMYKDESIFEMQAGRIKDNFVEHVVNLVSKFEGVDEQKHLLAQVAGYKTNEEDYVDKVDKLYGHFKTYKTKAKGVESKLSFNFLADKFESKAIAYKNTYLGLTTQALLHKSSFPTEDLNANIGKILDASKLNNQETMRMTQYLKTAEEHKTKKSQIDFLLGFDEGKLKERGFAETNIKKFVGYQKELKKIRDKNQYDAYNLDGTFEILKETTDENGKVFYNVDKKTYGDRKGIGEIARTLLNKEFVPERLNEIDEASHAFINNFDSFTGYNAFNFLALKRIAENDNFAYIIDDLSADANGFIIPNNYLSELENIVKTGIELKQVQEDLEKIEKYETDVSRYTKNNKIEAINNAIDGFKDNDIVNTLKDKDTQKFGVKEMEDFAKDETVNFFKSLFGFDDKEAVDFTKIKDDKQIMIRNQIFFKKIKDSYLSNILNEGYGKVTINDVLAYDSEIMKQADFKTKLSLLKDSKDNIVLEKVLENYKDKTVVKNNIIEFIKKNDGTNAISQAESMLLNGSIKTDDDLYNFIKDLDKTHRAVSSTGKRFEEDTSQLSQSSKLLKEIINNEMDKIFDTFGVDKKEKANAILDFFDDEGKGFEKLIKNPVEYKYFLNDIVNFSSGTSAFEKNVYNLIKNTSERKRELLEKEQKLISSSIFSFANINKTANDHFMTKGGQLYDMATTTFENSAEFSPREGSGITNYIASFIKNNDLYGNLETRDDFFEAIGLVYGKHYKTQLFKKYKKSKDLIKDLGENPAKAAEIFAKEAQTYLNKLSGIVIGDQEMYKQLKLDRIFEREQSNVVYGYLSRNPHQYMSSIRSSRFVMLDEKTRNLSFLGSMFGDTNKIAGTQSNLTFIGKRTAIGAQGDFDGDKFQALMFSFKDFLVGGKDRGEAIKEYRFYKNKMKLQQIFIDYDSNNDLLEGLKKTQEDVKTLLKSKYVKNGKEKTELINTKLNETIEGQIYNLLHKMYGNKSKLKDFDVEKAFRNEENHYYGWKFENIRTTAQLIDEEESHAALPKFGQLFKSISDKNQKGVQEVVESLSGEEKARLFVNMIQPENVNNIEAFFENMEPEIANKIKQYSKDKGYGSDFLKETYNLLIKYANVNDKENKTVLKWNNLSLSESLYENYTGISKTGIVHSTLTTYRDAATAFHTKIGRNELEGFLQENNTVKTKINKEFIKKWTDFSSSVLYANDISMTIESAISSKLGTGQDAYGVMRNFKKIEKGIGRSIDFFFDYNDLEKNSHLNFNFEKLNEFVKELRKDFKGDFKNDGYQKISDIVEKVLLLKPSEDDFKKMGENGRKSYEKMIQNLTSGFEAMIFKDVTSLGKNISEVEVDGRKITNQDIMTMLGNFAAISSKSILDIVTNTGEGTQDSVNDLGREVFKENSNIIFGLKKFFNSSLKGFKQNTLIASLYKKYVNNLKENYKGKNIEEIQELIKNEGNNVIAQLAEFLERSEQKLIGYTPGVQTTTESIAKREKQIDAITNPSLLLENKPLQSPLQVKTNSPYVSKKLPEKEKNFTKDELALPYKERLLLPYKETPASVSNKVVENAQIVETPKQDIVSNVEGDYITKAEYESNLKEMEKEFEVREQTIRKQIKDEYVEEIKKYELEINRLKQKNINLETEVVNRYLEKVKKLESENSALRQKVSDLEKSYNDLLEQTKNNKHIDNIVNGPGAQIDGDDIKKIVEPKTKVETVSSSKIASTSDEVYNSGKSATNAVDNIEDVVDSGTVKNAAKKLDDVVSREEYERLASRLKEAETLISQSKDTVQDMVDNSNKLKTVNVDGNSILKSAKNVANNNKGKLMMITATAILGFSLKMFQGGRPAIDMDINEQQYERSEGSIYRNLGNYNINTNIRGLK
jgi:hypothetical protein